jgi:hypothetical protein
MSVARHDTWQVTSNNNNAQTTVCSRVSCTHLRLLLFPLLQRIFEHLSLRIIRLQSSNVIYVEMRMACITQHGEYLRLLFGLHTLYTENDLDLNLRVVTQEVDIQLGDMTIQLQQQLVTTTTRQLNTAPGDSRH